LIHGLDTTSRGRTTDEVRHETKLRVRVTLTGKEVFVRSLKSLLLLRLQLLPRRRLRLIDCRLLTKLLLSKVAKHTRRSQLLLDTLQSKIGTELPRLFAKLSTKLTLTKCLLLSLKLGLLISQLRLQSLLRSQLLNTEFGGKILLTSGQTRLLVGKCSLHSSLLISESCL
jgi:hypothetical protein